MTADVLGERVAKHGGTRVHRVADHAEAAAAVRALLGEKDLLLTIGVVMP